MIIQYIAVMLAALIGIVLQTTQLRYLTDDLQVDFLFVIVVILGIFKDPVHGSIKSCSIGYFQDLFHPEVTGMFMTARMVVFLAAQTLRGRLSPDTPLSQFTIALGLGVLDRIVVMGLQSIFSVPPSITGSTLLYMLIGTVINAALVPFAYLLFRMVPGFIELPRGPRIVR